MAPKAKSTSALFDNLQENVASIFDQAQTSVANHRKNCVALHKLYIRSVSSTTKHAVDENGNFAGERLFGDIFVDMVNRILVIKKGSSPADRVVRFIGSFVRYLTEKGSEGKKKPTSETASAMYQACDEDDEDTPQTRFISRLLSYLLRGFHAKDKTVRFRAVHIVAELISHLGELDEDMYETLRTRLMERSRDKEAYIRAHAIAALSKLLAGEDPDELAEGEPSILDTLLDCLCYDPAYEVRRFALLNTPLTSETLPAILTRTRDIDPSVRAYLYAAVLLPASSSAPPSASITRQISTSPTRLKHPRQLTIAQREMIVRDGLGDREGKVRAAAGKMLGAWYDKIVEENRGKEQEDDGNVNSLLAFLKLFDVASPEGGPVACDAIKSIFITRPQVQDDIVFSDDYWRNLTPESILLARVFIEHLEGSSDEARIEASSLPVVTAFAFYTQEACNAIFDTMESLEEARVVATEQDDLEDNEELDKLEAELVDRVFVLGEILKIALKLDYTDEIGRRKMFKVIRDILAHELFPEDLMDIALDVLKETTSGEKEIIRIIVEIINELRDGLAQSSIEGLGEQSRDVDASVDTTRDISRISRRCKPANEMTPDERAQADEVDIRCLNLCIATLKRVTGTFEENSTLEGILADLIIPAVKRRELVLRERGLVSLGLCCLIAKNMAMSSFQLFLNQVQSAPEALKLKVLQVIFDILMVYDDELLKRSKDVAERIITFLLQTLEVEESKAIQALLCLGISKLMLNGLVTDERVLTSLVLAYVSPMTADNQELRQCLSYFLPVYCYSSPQNQSRMQSIFLSAFDLVTNVYNEMDEEEEMITPLQFGMLFVDWTNPLKRVSLDVIDTPSTDTHVDFAVDLLKALYKKGLPGEDKKVLCQILGKLSVPEHPEELSLLLLHTLLENIEDTINTDDTATLKILDRFSAKFTKQFSKDVNNIDVAKYVNVDEFREVCGIVGIEVLDPEGPPSPIYEPANEPRQQYVA
ncbi:hypothetical protein K474DRAFT_1603932 [Panus rudis PR-1116 ss-1]|nr:hypothetical protein K474DRAFT_1603932 [Panus rudis PR-1116 ss-1]